MSCSQWNLQTEFRKPKSINMVFRTKMKKIKESVVQKVNHPAQ